MEGKRSCGFTVKRNWPFRLSNRRRIGRDAMVSWFGGWRMIEMVREEYGEQDNGYLKYKAEDA